MNKLHQCTPIEPQPCNSHASNTLTHATSMQPTSLKALVEQRFTRNSPCNKSATHSKKPCNFKLEKRILIMAKKWNYSLEDLSWALTQAKLDHKAWEQLCSYDEDNNFSNVERSR